MHRAFLTALAQAGKPLTKKQLRVRASYRDSGPVSKAFAEMVRNDWVREHGSAKLGITDAGLQALGAYDPLPTGAALRSALVDGSLGKLSQMERKFLDLLIRGYPDTWSKAKLREEAGYADSGPVSKAFAHLVALDYVVAEGSGYLKASDELFQEG
jgi:hypothetical protein